MLEISAVSPDLPFGSMIHGLTLEQVGDDQTRAKLRDLWFDRGLLVFRGSDTSTEFHLRLSEVFGTLVSHQQPELWVDGHPELVSFTSDAESDMVAEIDGKVVAGCLPWHGDARWLAEPTHGAILKVHKHPREGGETGFIDLISTYDRLPAALKARVEKLELIVRFCGDPNLIYRFQPQKVRMIDEGRNARSLAARADFPPIAQRLVYLQPETGRKVLGFTPNPLQEIIGLEPEESDALLYELASYATDERYAYVHSYEENDLVLWDNLRLLHKAYGVPPGEEREVWRTTLASADYPIARSLEEGGFSWRKPASG